MDRVIFSVFLKNSFLPFLKRISTASNGAWPPGKVMLESQSKTESLLQLSVPQDPLLLHPFGAPPSVVEQFVHAII
jgi:hypothetical protein